MRENIEDLLPALWHLAKVEIYLRRELPNIISMTMISSWRLRDLLWRVDQVTANNVAGALVECGTWRGGASFLMAKRLTHLRQDRLVWMFDSFEGLPQPTAQDGPRADAYMTQVPSADNYDRCQADLEQVEADAVRLGVADKVRIVKGWFDETLAIHRGHIGPIALLRIDGDWYESVKICLEVLYDSVSPRGLVIVDDYYDWDGASRAVHEFLASRDLNVKIRTTPGKLACAYFEVPD
jgi:O-methyltransferase